MRAYIRVYKLRIVVTIHSHGRLFNLCVEWISTNPGRGYEAAPPLYRGLLFRFHRITRKQYRMHSISHL